MDKRYRRLLGGLAVTVGLAYGGVAYMLTGRQTEVAPEEALPGSPDATSIIQNFQHIESTLDRVSWELSAARAELVGRKATLDGIRMRFFTPDQEVITLAGQRGYIDLDSKNVRVTGQVVAEYEGTYRFHAEEVSWDADRRLLTSPGPVRIEGPEGEVRGEAMEAKPLRKRFSIEGGVSVDFNRPLLEPPPREETRP
jgi:LPS export ABC transporter protein LptC